MSLPKTDEGELLSRIKWLLQMCKNRGLLDYTRIHTQAVLRGNFRKGTGFFSKNRDMAGFADIEIVVPPHGRVGYMELKSKKGILSEEQILFLSSRQKMGCQIAHVKTFDQGVEFLKKMGVDIDGVIKGYRPESSSSGGSSLNPS